MSVFLSKSNIDELITNNIYKLLEYRNITNIDKTKILSIIKNHEIKVINNFLIGYIYEKELNTFINKLNTYNYKKGILILDTSDYDFSKDKLYKNNINIFIKTEFYENYSQSVYYFEHKIIDEKVFKEENNEFPTILISQLPKILVHDRAIRYIGGNVGDIIKIRRNCPSGPTNTYRIVI